MKNCLIVILTLVLTGSAWAECPCNKKAYNLTPVTVGANAPAWIENENLETVASYINHNTMQVGINNTTYTLKCAKFRDRMNCAGQTMMLNLYEQPKPTGLSCAVLNAEVMQQGKPDKARFTGRKCYK